MCIFEILIIRKYLDIKKNRFQELHCVYSSNSTCIKVVFIKSENISNGELETLAALSIHLERTLIDSVYQLFFRI